MKRPLASTLCRLVLTAFVVAGGLLGTSATAADRSAPEPGRGFVDGTAFRDLAGEDGEVVEVNLGGPMLQALAGGKRSGAELNGILSGVHSIRAFILNLEGQSGKIDQALRLAADIERRLTRAGWSPLVTVRDGRSRVNVLALNDDETIQGLVVMAISPDSGETVFVNIAGTLDLARLGELSEVVDVPGLDALGKSSGSERKPRREPE